MYGCIKIPNKIKTDFLYSLVATGIKAGMLSGNVQPFILRILL